jgi:polar amino acid transport system substrate-binding protein
MSFLSKLLFSKLASGLGWLALATCSSIVLPASAAEKLRLIATIQPPYTTSEKNGFVDQLLPVVFREAGLEGELLIYQGAFERQLINADLGLDDGVAARAAGLEKQYPNLIRVPEEVVSFDFVAFTTQHRFPTANWDALSPYAVSYIIGWKIFELNVPTVKELTLVTNVEQLFTVLDLERADVVLYERLHGLMVARAKGMKVQVMEPPLSTNKLYMYLHKKHAALVPRVAQALARLKQNGTYRRMYDSTLKPVAP